MTDKPWGGRFGEKTLEAVEAFTESISFDHRLGLYDVELSMAHAAMLEKVGLITNEERAKLQGGLAALGEKISGGGFSYRTELEDIHMHIEVALIDLLGDVGRKIHTGRSRNDQVATAFRMWTRDAQKRVIHQLGELQAAFVQAAERDGMVVIPGYTHLQRAQPMVAAHNYLAHVERLDRDRERLLDALKRTNILPLGTAAIAGTSLPLDRSYVAQKLNFDDIATNSLDATCDRDFAIETAFALSLLANHLASWSEEWILWSTTEFGFISLPDRLCTGSSIMPQKKNPDVLELIRGRSARVMGALTQLLVLTKGLPLGYQRDLQEDKLALFQAFDTVEACLKMAALVVEGARLNQDRIQKDLESGFLDATTLMELLIKEKVPMRLAHEIVGKLVKEAEFRHLNLSELPESVLVAMHPALTKAKTSTILGAHQAVHSFTSVGSTNPERVKAALSDWKSRLASRGSPIIHHKNDQ